MEVLNEDEQALPGKRRGSVDDARESKKLRSDVCASPNDEESVLEGSPAPEEAVVETWVLTNGCFDRIFSPDFQSTAEHCIYFRLNIIEGSQNIMKKQRQKVRQGLSVWAKAIQKLLAVENPWLSPDSPLAQPPSEGQLAELDECEIQKYADDPRFQEATNNSAPQAGDEGGHEQPQSDAEAVVEPTVAVEAADDTDLAVDSMNDGSGDTHARDESPGGAPHEASQSECKSGDGLSPNMGEAKIQDETLDGDLGRAPRFEQIEVTKSDTPRSLIASPNQRDCPPSPSTNDPDGAIPSVADSHLRMIHEQDSNSTTSKARGTLHDEELRESVSRLSDCSPDPATDSYPNLKAEPHDASEENFPADDQPKSEDDSKTDLKVEENDPEINHADAGEDSKDDVRSSDQTAGATRANDSQGADLDPHRNGSSKDDDQSVAVSTLPPVAEKDTATMSDGGEPGSHAEAAAIHSTAELTSTGGGSVAMDEVTAKGEAVSQSAGNSPSATQECERDAQMPGAEPENEPEGGNGDDGLGPRSPEDHAEEERSPLPEVSPVRSPVEVNDNVGEAGDLATNGEAGSEATTICETKSSNDESVRGEGSGSGVDGLLRPGYRFNKLLVDDKEVLEKGLEYISTLGYSADGGDSARPDQSRSSERGDMRFEYTMGESLKICGIEVYQNVHRIIVSVISHRGNCLGYHIIDFLAKILSIGRILLKTDSGGNILNSDFLNDGNIPGINTTFIGKKLFIPPPPPPHNVRIARTNATLTAISRYCLHNSAHNNNPNNLNNGATTANNLTVFGGGTAFGGQYQGLYPPTASSEIPRPLLSLSDPPVVLQAPGQYRPFPPPPDRRLGGGGRLGGGQVQVGASSEHWSDPRLQALPGWIVSTLLDMILRFDGQVIAAIDQCWYGCYRSQIDFRVFGFTGLHDVITNLPGVTMRKEGSEYWIQVNASIVEDAVRQRWPNPITRPVPGGLIPAEVLQAANAPGWTSTPFIASEKVPGYLCARLLDLVARNNGKNIGHIQQAWRKTYNEPIDFVALGFSKFSDLLQEVPGINLVKDGSNITAHCANYGAAPVTPSLLPGQPAAAPRPASGNSKDQAANQLLWMTQVLRLQMQLAAMAAQQQQQPPAAPYQQSSADTLRLMGLGDASILPAAKRKATPSPGGLPPAKPTR